MPCERTSPEIDNCNLAELESALDSCKGLPSHARLSAIRALLLGYNFKQVEQLYRTSERSLIRWVSEFNSQGIDGLLDRPRSGRPRIIVEQTEELKKLIENPNLADEHFWTGKKFHGYLKNELKEEISYRSTVRFMHEQGYALKVPRRLAEGQDEELRKAYLERLSVLQANPELELWYLDESGIEGDPRPRRRWAKKGSTPTIPYIGNHIRMNVCGMVCPDSGEFLCLEFDYMDKEAFQIFLDFANKELIDKTKKQIIICDNASWHKAALLDWGNIEVVYLPPYSPDFNPIERLWLRLKADFFQDFIAKTHDELLAQLDKALNHFLESPELIASICR